MTIYRFVVGFNHPDPRSAGYLHDAHALGFDNLQRITCQDLFFIEGQLSLEDCRQLTLKLLTDPVTQSAEWTELSTENTPQSLSAVIVDVALRPGVTAPVSEQIVRAAHELGFDGVYRASTGLRYQLEGLTVSQAEKLAKQLLANAVIQHWTLGEIAPTFPQEVASSGEVGLLSVRNVPNDELLALSKERRAALDLNEMKAIQDYFRKEKRDPTDVEFEMIAQTWSEHCGHKTFKARVEVEKYTSKQVSGKQGDLSTSVPVTLSTVDSLIKTYLKAATDKINAPWVISAFVDNAGIVDFDDEYEVSFKVETHNHPSAIEPFGGANTGVGGVIRDVIGVSAKPIANTDILCFGPQNLHLEALPEGVLHPRRIQGGVVAGVQDYGNKIGIPTVNGAILYDEGYTANPLVFCGCVGLAPKGKHIKSPRPGDRVIVIGGRTGRDGLRGATFSSMTMDAQTGEVSGASVQIGDPITEKGLIDVVVRARDLGLYTDITDCGAGGLSSAVGEMTSKIGGDVDLASVRLKYPGLAPWEIWLSEAQERMVLAVPPENIPALQELCDTFDTELTDIGAFTGHKRIVVRYDDKVVLDLENEFLHEGIPQRQLKAVISDQSSVSRIVNRSLSKADVKKTLLKLLSHPNIASKAHVIHLYDHEIQGGTVVKPLTGAMNDGPSDATVLKPIGTKGTKGIVLSNGINPEYGKRDAYNMTWAVVDEAIRNAVAVGADPERIAILDNFCWGDPLRTETMGSLVEACRGCYDAALHYGTPYISGKDSLNNEYLGNDGQRHSIPPTLLISALGIMEDVNKAVTMDLKEAGNEIYVIGKFEPVFGGSHYSLVMNEKNNESTPVVHEITPQVYKALHRAMNDGLIRSAHDISEGGLAVAAAEMCIGGRLGIKLESNLWDDVVGVLFGESTGSLLVEVSPSNKESFLNLFGKLPLYWIGTVNQQPTFTALFHGLTVLDVPVSQLVEAWNTSL